MPLIMSIAPPVICIIESGSLKKITPRKTFKTGVSIDIIE
jgi:hypothetical protein